MKRLTTTIISLLFALFIFADEKVVNISIMPSAVGDSLMLYVSALGDTNDNIVEMQCKNGVYSGKVKESPDGLYQLTGVKGYLQTFLYLYLPQSGSEENLTLSFDGRLLLADFNADNSAISQFNAAKLSLDRKIWDKSVNNLDACTALLGEYLSEGDKAVAMAASTEVKEFIALWSRVSAYDACYPIRRKGSLSREEVGTIIAERMAVVSPLLNSDYAVYFPATQTVIREAVPYESTLVEKFEILYGKFSNERVRDYIKVMLVENFINTHDYNNEFDSGLEMLSSVVEKYSLNKKLIKEYESRRATVKGASFPDVVLRDANGNTMDFSAFRGKYVYIDMWASWCGPCTKEVPHLKKLEEELENENVVFLSISIDKKVEPWLNKMNALDMHGNQWISTDNKIAEVLNVKGIPFFLIYDKEGKLYIYNAPRPSSGDTLKLLLENLN